MGHGPPWRPASSNISVQKATDAFFVRPGFQEYFGATPSQHKPLDENLTFSFFFYYLV